MDTTARGWQIPEGTDIYGADGDKVGKVVATTDAYVVVEKGFFFPTDYYIPTGAIASFDGDNAYLTVTKDEALNQGWDAEPVATTGTYDPAMPTDRPARGAATAYGTDDRPMERRFEQDAHSDRSHAHEQDRTVVPVHEEELTAAKRPVERGAVRVEKDVVTEERTVDVPVVEDRVRIERRAVDRAEPAGADAFQEETIEVPLRSEEVDVQKRTRVAEEVEIDKDRVARTERVAGTVRREEVHVDDTATTDST